MAAAFAREGGYGASASVIGVDSARPDRIIVPDARLLFTADFHRAGPDLVLTGLDGRHHIIPGYFANEHRPALSAPNGASLAPDLIELLAGSPTPGEYAQAQSAAPRDDAIGKIEKVVGNVTVVRNGVSVALNVGDAVYKSDVVQTGVNSAVGIGFPDGTALNLVDNTRMALNDYSYDPNSTSNTALFSLVEGTFSFVAGKVAHTGDMKMSTPVATMGIRGTTGWVQEIATISANVGDATYSFAVTPDYGTNQSGIYDLIDQNGNVIATVSQTGFLTLVTPQGFGVSPTVTTQPMTNVQLQFEQQIIQEVFQTLNLINNPNPQTNPNGGSSSPPSQQNNNLEQLIHEEGSPFNVNNNSQGTNGTGTGTQFDVGAIFNFPTGVVYWEPLGSGPWFNTANWSDLYVPLNWQTVIINPTLNNVPVPATVTVDHGDAFATNLLVGPAAVLDIASGGSLTVSNIVEVFGVIEANSTGTDPTFTAEGPVKVQLGGEIEALGTNAAVYFSSDSVDNSGVILAKQSGAIYFQQATVTNEVTGLITAGPDGTISITDSTIIGGTLSTAAAASGLGAGLFDFFGNDAVDDAFISNSGTIQIDGSLALDGTTLRGGTILNNGSIDITGLTTIEGNAVLSGGPITVETGQTLKLDDVTISNNSTVTLIGSAGYSVLNNLNAFVPLTLNDVGQVLGRSTDANGHPDAVIYSNGAISATIDDPSGVATGVFAFNSAGQVVGTYTGNNGTLHGFLYSNGNYITLDDPSAGTGANKGTEALGINKAGEVVGVYTDAGGASHGFLSNTVTTSGGNTTTTYTTLDVTYTDSSGTLHTAVSTAPQAINNLGQVVGTYIDANGNEHGFLYANGSFTTLDDSTPGATATTPLAVNNIGQIVGTYKDAGGNEHGFLYSDGVFFTLDDPAPGATATTPLAINDAGQIVGTYFDADGEHGFLYSDGIFTEVSDGSGNSLVELLGINNSGQILGEDDTGTAGFIYTLPTILQVDSGHSLTLDGTTTISGGAVIDDGTIDVAGSSTLSNLTLKIDATGIVNATGAIGILVLDTGNIVANAGLLEATSGGELDVKDHTISNTGSGAQGILVDGNSKLLVDSTSLTLNGGGDVALTGTITGAAGADRLVNSDNTITGSGTISNLTLTNEAGATIDATGILILDTGNIVANAGLLEATSGGELDVQDHTISNTGGGADGILVVRTSTLLVDSNSLTLNGSGQVTLVGAITGKAAADALINVDNVISGSGMIGTLTLTNDAGATIEATTGTLTIGPATITNYGLLEANGGELDIDNTPVTNTGTLLATDNSTLVLNGEIVTNFITTSKGTVEVDAVDASHFSTLDLESATISGGIVTVDGLLDSTGISAIDGAAITVASTGKLEATAGTLTIDPSSINNDGLLEANGGELDITGTPVVNAGTLLATNNSTMALDGETVTNFVTINTTVVNGTVEVDAGSKLTLNSVTIAGGTINNGTVTAGGFIEVLASSTISGAGLNNGGVTVDAHQTLTLDNDTVTGTTFTDTASGAVLALDANDTLTLTGVTIIGGTLDVASGAILDLYNTQIVGVTLSDLGTINVFGTSTIDSFASVFSGQTNVASLQTLFLDNAFVTGTVTNHGTLQVDVNDSATFSGVTVTGGTFIDDGIIDVTGATTLNGGLTLNNGTVKVESATLKLDDVTVSGTTISEETTGSLVQVDGSDTLTLEGHASIGGGAISNLGQIIVAGAATLSGDVLTNSGATVTIDDGGTLTLSQTTVSGGTINDGDQANTGHPSGGLIHVTGASTIDSNAQLNDGAVTVDAKLTLDNATVNASTITDNASIVLNDTVKLENGAIIQGASSSSLGPVTNDVTLEVAAGTATLLDVTLTNSGTVKVDDGTTLVLSGTAIDGGTINDGDQANTGHPSGGLIHVTGASTIDSNAQLNDGAVTVDAKLTLDNATVNASTITDNASIVLNDTVKLENGAIIQGASSSSLGPVTNDVTLEVAAGTATLLDVTLTNSGTVKVDDGTTLVLSGTAIDGGTINDGDQANTGHPSGGLIHVTGASTIDSNAQLNDGAVTVDAKLTLDNATVNASTITDNASIVLNHTVKLENGAIIQGASGSSLGPVTNDVTLEVAAGTATLLDVTLTNSGTVKVDDGTTLVLSGSAIDGGTINDGDQANTGHPSGGLIHVTGASIIDSNAQLNDGAVTVDAQLTLDNATVNASTITDNASIVLNDTVKLENGAIIQGASGSSLGPVTNDVTLEVAAGTATLLDVTLTNSGTVKVDDGTTLVLSGSAIDGGTINDGDQANTGTPSGGLIHVTGASIIDSNAQLNDGAVTVDAQLTLDNATVNASTITDNASIVLNHTVKLENGAIIQGASGSSLGPVTNDVTLEVAAGTATLLDVTLTNSGTVKVDDGTTLVLSGTAIDGGTINDGDQANTGHPSGGLIHVTGASTIDSNAQLNDGAVTVDAKLTLDNATVNASTITDNASIVLNDTVKLENGAIIQGASSSSLGPVTNDVTLEVAAGTATLLDVTLTNSGTVKVDDGTTLVLSGSAIDGGTINDGDQANTGHPSGGLIHVTGASIIDSNAQLNDGAVTVDAQLTLDNATVNASTITDNASIVLNDTVKLENGAIIQGASGSSLGPVTNDVTLEVAAGTATLLDVTLTNSGTVKVDDGTTLVLSGSAIDGGTINDGDQANTGHPSGGLIHVTGASTIDSNAQLNDGAVTVDAKLTLDNATVNASTITDNASIVLNHTVKLENGAIIQGASGSSLGPVTNDVTLEVAAGTATLLDVTLTNSGTVKVDDGTTLVLSGTAIDGGTINDGDQANTGTPSGGLIHVTGASIIDSNAQLNDGAVTVDAQLTLDNATVNASTITDNASIVLNHTVKLENGAIIQGASGSSLGPVTNDVTLEVAAGTATLLDVTLTNSGTVKVDDGTTLVLSGTAIDGGTINDGDQANTGHPSGGLIHVTGASTIDSNAQLNDGAVTVDAKLTLDNATVNASTITDNASIVLNDTVKLENGAIIQGASSSSLGPVTNDVTLEVAAGTATLLDVTLTNSGTVKVDDGTTLVLSGTAIDGGTINDGDQANTGHPSGGLIHVTGASTIDSNAQLNDGAVTVDAKLTLDNATVNASTITDNASIVLNDTVKLENGAIIQGASGSSLGPVTNDVTLEVAAGTATLLDVTLTNSGTVKVDDGTTLVLSGSAIDGGTINDGDQANTGHPSGGLIHVTGASTIDSNAQLNDGAVTVDAQLTLDNATVNASTITDNASIVLNDTVKLENGAIIQGASGSSLGPVTNDVTLEVAAGTATLLDVTLTNSGTVKVDDGTTLVLSGSAIDGGTINDGDQANTGHPSGGLIHVTGASTIDSNAQLNDGAVTVDAKLTLDNATVNASTITDNASIVLNHTVKLENGAIIQGASGSSLGPVTNDVTLEVAAGTATLLDVTLTNSGTVKVDDGTTLVLSGTAIDGGTINDGDQANTGTPSGGLIHVTGASIIDSNAQLNDGAVTVDAQLTLDNATVNASTITDNASIVLNHTVKLENGAIIQGASGSSLGPVTNDVTLEVAAGTATLLDVTLTNSGTVKVDDGTTLVLSGTAIDGGTINDGDQANTGTPSGGLIHVTGASIIDSNAQLNDGAVTVDAQLTLDNATVNASTITDNASIVLNHTVKLENGAIIQGASGSSLGPVTNDVTLEVAAGTATLLDVTLTNSGTVKVDDGTTLVLSGTAIDGGTINDGDQANTGTPSGGLIHVTGASTIDSNAQLNDGAVTVDAKLTLDNATVNASTITDNASIVLNDTVKLENGAIIQGASSSSLGPVTNDVTLEVAAGTATLLDVTLTNSGTVKVDDGTTLVLSGTAIDGGTINDGDQANTGHPSGGLIHVTGASTIDSNAQLNDGAVTVDAKLTLDNATVNASTITDNASIVLNDTVKLENGAIIQGASSSSLGPVTNDVTLEVAAGTATLLDVTLTNSGTVKVDDGTTLVLSGTAIDGGTINDGDQANTGHPSGGLIHVTGASTIDSNAQLNDGAVTVDAKLTLDNATVNASTITDNASIVLNDTVKLENGAIIQGASGSSLGPVTNDVTLEVAAGTATLLDVTLTNSGTVKVDDGTTLVLSGSAIDGGTINDGDQANTGHPSGGLIHVTGASIIDSNAQLNDGAVTVDAQLTLDNATVNASTITDNASIVLNDTVKLENGAIIQGASGSSLGPVTNDVTLEVAAGTATLLDVTLTNSGTVKVDDGTTLVLSGSAIDGGTINDGDQANTGTPSGGLIHVTGASIIDSNAQLNDGAVTVDAQLTLDNATVNASTITDNASIVLNHTVKLENGAIIQGASGSSLGPVTNDVTLEVAAGTATLLDVTLTNSGTVKVDDGTTLVLSGSAIDGGTINDGDQANTGTPSGGLIHVTGASIIDSNAQLNDGAVTVDAQLTLDNATVNASTITDNASIVLNHTVKLENGAIIQGASGSSLGPVTNDVTLEVAAGTATLLDVTLTNSGTVKVDDGTTLVLSGSAIDGGTINDYSVTGGIIDVTGATTLDGGLTLNNGTVKVESTTLKLDDVTVSGTTITEETTGSLVQVDGSDTLTLEGVTFLGSTGSAGTIVNSGTITIDNTLTISGPSLFALAISGAGTVSLNGGTIAGTGGVGLTNDGNTILSTGNSAIGSGSPNIFNLDNAAGTIEAVSGTLTIKTDAPLVNAGTLEAANGATLQINVGQIQNSGHIDILSGGTLTINNPLTVTGGVTTGGTVALTGGGDVTLSGGTISGVTSQSETLKNIDNTIKGFGAIGTGSASGIVLDVNNLAGGMIEATGTNKTLVLKNHGAINNSGTLEAATGATLQINVDSINNATNGNITVYGTLGIDNPLTVTGGVTTGGAVALSGAGTVTLSTGTISSAVAGEVLTNSGNTISGTGQIGDGTTSNLALDNTSGVVKALGGTLTIETGNSVSNAATLDAASGATLQIDDAMSNSGTGIIEAQSGGILVFDAHTINNSGAIKLDAGTVSAPAKLEIIGTVTLQLAGVTQGSVTLGSHSAIFSDGTHAGTLVNAGNIISGQGTIGDAHLTLNNEAAGIVDANISGDMLVLNTGTNAITNAGTLEATSGGILVIDSNVGNAGGTVKAVGAGSLVELNNVTIAGGTLSTGDVTDHNNGLIAVEAAGGTNTSILDGSVHTVTVDGYVQVEAGANLELIGTIDNLGIIDVDPISGSATNALEIHGTVTLNGGGTVTLDGSSDQIIAASGGDTLDNYDTISGAGAIGHIGGGTLTLNNESGSTIEAIGGTLTVDTGATFTNSGTIETGSGGTLVIDDAVAGTGSGTIGSGGIMDFEASVASGQTITFVDGTGTLKLADPATLHDPAAFAATLTGLQIGDVIDLTSQSVTAATWDGTTLTLNGSASNFTISGLSASDTFFFASDGYSGTDLTVEAAPLVAISAIDGNGIINFANAAAGVDISGTASDSSISVNNHSITVDIVNASNAVVDTYTSTISGGIWTVDVTEAQAQALSDGSYTVTAHVSDAAVDPTAEATQTLRVDEDTDETPTLSFNDTLIGGPAGSGAVSTAVHFTVDGLDAADDTAVITFTDVNGKTVTDTLSADGETTVDLSSLADGTVTAALAATDTAGNSFSAASSNTATLDQDTNEAPTLSFNDTLIGGPAGSGAVSTAVHFTVDGLDAADDTAVITFTDVNGKTVTDTLSADGETTVDLSSLADGTVTAALAATDTAGNSFSAASSNTATLDQDTNEAPTLSFNDTLIGGPAGSGAVSTAVHFTVDGLDAADDTAVITFTDVNGKTVTDTLSADGETTVDLSSLADGTVTAALAATDTAGNSFSAASSNTATLDQDTNEAPTLSFNDTLIGGPAGSGAVSTAVHFTVDGLDAADDTAVITFTDVNGKTVTDTLSADGETTVDLSSLADGTVTAALAATDTAGNSFSAASSNTATLDQDTNEAPTLSFNDTLIGGPAGSGAVSTAVHFTVDGLDAADDTAVITFTDVNGKTVTDTLSADGETTVDLSSLADGTVTAALAATDTAGNSFSAASSNTATLDQDTNEAPTLSFNDTLIGGPAGSGAVSTAVHFTVDGLDAADDTAVITFTDVNGKTVTDTLSADGETTVDLSSLADGTVTAALAATDTAGNSFSAASSNTATLDQDTNEAPTLSFNDTLIGGPAGSGAVSTAVHFTVDGLDAADDTAVITFTDVNGKTVTDTLSADGETTVDLSSLADGTVTAALAATDTAGNSFSAASSNTATLDQDTNEAPTLSFNDTLIGGPAGSGAVSTAVHFTVDGLDAADDTAVITFTDVNGKTVTDTLSADGETTVDLSSLADGTVTAALAATDTAGNSFSAASSNTATLDQDTNEAPTLSFNDTLIGGPAGSGAVSTAVHFTVDGLDAADDTAVITFTDVNGKTVTDTLSADGETTVDLSSLADGTVTAALAATDTAGNSFSAASSNTATLDQDTNEAPTLSFNDTLIGGPAGSGAVSTAVHFTVDGLDAADDTAVITFTDVNGKTVTDTLSADGETTVDLSSLADGTVTAALAATDTAGNSFSAASSNTATLDQDTNEAPSIVVDGGSTTPIGHAGASAVAFTVSGIDTDDSGTLTFSDGTNSVAVTITDGVVVAGTDNTTTAVNLSSLADDTSITSSLALTDTAGNSFTASGNAVTLAASGPTEPFTWNGGSGDWEAFNWNNAGQYPGSGDGVDISATGTYIVTVDHADAAASLSITSGDATLDIVTGSTSSASYNGSLVVTGSIDNAGTILVQGYNSSPAVASSATFEGAVTNTGHITLQSSIDGNLVTATFEGTITNGGGTITVGSHAALVLSGATVEGGTISNSGVIDVTGASASTIDDAASVQGGPLSVASGATLTLDDVALGSIDITDGGTISVSGTLTFSSSNTITSAGSSTSIVVNSSTIEVKSGGPLTLAGIEVDNGSSGKITIDTGATLTVSSVVVGSSSAVAAGATFDSGTITNNGTITVDPNESLTLQDGVTVNSGTITVKTSSTLYIENGFGSHGATLDDVTLQNSGTIQVDGGTSAAVNLILTDGSIVNGGTLSIGGSGEVEIQHGSGGGPNYGATFDSGLTVSNQGTITVDTGATLTLVGSTATIIGTNSSAALASGSQTHGGINNSGTIELGTTAASAMLDIGATVTLYGSGTLTLENSGDVITGASGGGELFNYGKIVGAGSIDNSSGNGLTLINEAGGVIDANGGGGATLTLNTGNNIDNAGLIEGTSGGNLVIDDSVVNSGAGAVIADGGTVTVGSGGGVSGGTLEITNGGVFDLLNSFDQSVTFVGFGILELAQSQQYTTGTIYGYSDAAVLDLSDINFISGTTTVTDDNLGIDSDKLIVFDGTHTSNIFIASTSAYPTDWTVLSDGHNGTFLLDPDLVVAESTTQTLNAASTDMVAFTGSVGTLEFTTTASATNFTGEIAGISGDGTQAGSDILDFTTFNPLTTSVIATFNANDTTTLLVTDSSDSASASLTLIGNYSSSNGVTWNVHSDGSAGTDIFDPQTGSVTAPSVVSTATSTATSDSASGSLSFVDSHTGDTITDSVTPDSSHYAGSFSVDPPTESNGTVSVGFEFMANNDQINLSPGETLTQSYSVSVADAQNPAENVNQTVSVTIGGPGNDHFVFAPGIGADTITNFNPQQDTIELDHFANAQTIQELQSFITTDAHGDALINLGHNDSITLPGTTEAQLQQVIQAGHVLLH